MGSDLVSKGIPRLHGERAELGQRGPEQEPGRLLRRGEQLPEAPGPPHPSEPG